MTWNISAHRLFVLVVQSAIFRGCILTKSGELLSFEALKSWSTSSVTSWRYYGLTSKSKKWSHWLKLKCLRNEVKSQRNCYIFPKCSTVISCMIESRHPSLFLDSMRSTSFLYHTYLWVSQQPATLPTLELQNLSYDFPELHKIRRSPDLGAVKFWNSWSGSQSSEQPGESWSNLAHRAS